MQGISGQKVGHSSLQPGRQLTWMRWFGHMQEVHMVCTIGDHDFGVPVGNR